VGNLPNQVYSPCLLMLLLPVILMVPDVCGSVMANVILNLCPLPDIVRIMIRLRSARWAGHVEHVIDKCIQSSDRKN
jgi:hypothetical protein